MLGEHQPFENKGGRGGTRAPIGEAVPDYYPAIVEPKIFYAVQEALSENRGKGGRTGKATNLLKHLAVCAYCGGPMHFADKGPRPKGGQYLYCYNGRRGVGCERRSIRYSECEALVLENCEHLRPEQVLPNPDEQESRCDRLRLQIQGNEAEQMAIDAQLQNLTDQIAKTDRPVMRDRYEQKAAELDERRAMLDEQLVKDAQQLRKDENAQRSLGAWKKGLEELRAEAAKGGVEVRLRMQVHLRELIDKIEIFTHGHRKIFDHAGEDEAEREILASDEGKVLKQLRRRNSAEYWKQLYRHPLMKAATDGERMAELITVFFMTRDRNWRPDKTYEAFFAWVHNRRLSKDGRFLRIHFKTGEIIDIIPHGSIASGERLTEGKGRKLEWTYVDPDFNELVEEFNSRNRNF